MTSSLERTLKRVADESVRDFESALAKWDLHSPDKSRNARNGFWVFYETVDGTLCVMIGTRGDPRRFPGQLLRWIWSFERPGQRDLWQRPGGQPLECFIRLSLAQDDFIQTLHDLEAAKVWVESLDATRTRAWAAGAFQSDPPYRERATATALRLWHDGDGEDERDGDTTLTSVATAPAAVAVAASPDPATAPASTPASTPVPVPVLTPATTADARRLRETADALDALRASLLDDVNAALVGRRADGTPLPVKPGETFQRHTTGSLVVVLIKLLRQTAVSLASATEYARQGESDQ